MKFAHSTATAVVLLVGGLLGGCVSSQAPTSTNQALAIEDVIGQVQQALAGVQATLAARAIPPLKEVKLTLQTVATSKSGGALKLWVISLGGTAEKIRTQQIVLTLVPPSAGPPRLTAEASLTDELEAAILSAAEGVQKARGGRVPLVPSALEVEINFTARSSGTGGASVVLAPVTVGATGEVSAASVQTIRVSFAVK